MSLRSYKMLVLYEPMDLMGIYFPFSMEANYNQDMYKAKLPDTICHELAHTKGYIQEDEANLSPLWRVTDRTMQITAIRAIWRRLARLETRFLTTLLTIRR